MWSGPRNLSTALMRSFENRNDTFVWDEPFYAYYLKETKKNHPLKKEIIHKYETKINKLIYLVSQNKSNKKIFYQKHMTHHILEKTPIEWINNGINCFLIRDPKDVINSYIKKNQLNEINDLGFPMQKKLFNYVLINGQQPIVINADDLASNPKKILSVLCNILEIPYTNKMLNWPYGSRKTDGIWERIWYENVKSSKSFLKLQKNKSKLSRIHEKIYEESFKIYQELNLYNILNGR